MDPHFCGDLNLLLRVQLAECSTDGFFRCAIAISGGGVDPVNAAVYGGSQNLELLLSVGAGHEPGDRTGAEADFGDEETGSTETTLDHVVGFATRT